MNNYSLDFFDFSKINFSLVTIASGIFLVLLGVLYYLIYHKHHKRNQVELFELVELVTKFYVRTILLVVFLGIAVSFIGLAFQLRDERNDVIACILIAIIIASADILNYRKYIIYSLLDYNMEVRVENNERKLKIGEVLELICLIICVLAPIWRIPGFIQILDNKPKLAIELIKYFAISISALILIFSLNPLNIKRFFVEEKKEEPVKRKRGRPRKNPENTNEAKTSKTRKKKENTKK